MLLGSCPLASGFLEDHWPWNAAPLTKWWKPEQNCTRRYESTRRTARKPRLDRCTECKLISSAVFYVSKCSTQARNQLGTPVGTKSFLRVAHIFLCPTRFFRWASPPGYGPSSTAPSLSRTVVLNLSTHSYPLSFRWIFSYPFSEIK